MEEGVESEKTGRIWINKYWEMTAQEKEKMMP
jgi:hypothetical protein